MLDTIAVERAPGAAEALSRRSAGVLRDSWEWVANNSIDIALAVTIAVAIAAILVGVRRFGRRLVRERYMEEVDWRTIFGRVLAKTSIFFIVMVSAQLVSDQAETPRFLDRLIDVLFIVSAAIQAAVWGRELILGFVEGRIEEGEEKSTLGSAIGIIRLFVTIGLFAIAIILILDNLGVDVTGLVAGLGIGGIAIGLAAQGIFSDLFAALSIIFDKPFRRGDTITFGNPPTTGTVEHIGLKSTRIRSLQGEEIVVSNANLLNMQLQNWAMLVRRRVIMQFGVIYQTRAELLARIPGELKEVVEAGPISTFDRCHAFQFGASSIDFELAFYVEAAEYAAFMQARQDIMLGLIRRFEALGVDFAYPTQMGFLAGLDGKPVDPRQIPPHLAPAP